MTWLQEQALQTARKIWADGAGYTSVPGRPTIEITVGQGPVALAVGAGGVVWTLYSHLSFLFSVSLSGRRPIKAETLS